MRSDFASDLEDDSVEHAHEQEAEKTGQGHRGPVHQPVAGGRVEHDQRQNEHVRTQIDEWMCLQPCSGEELGTHQAVVAPHENEQPDEPGIEPQRQGQLNGPGDGADPAQLTQADQAARHRPIRPVAEIVGVIFELVGDTQVQEEEQERDKRSDDRRQRHLLRTSRKQARDPQRRGAQGDDDDAVDEEGKALALIDPEAYG